MDYLAILQFIKGQGATWFIKFNDALYPGISWKIIYRIEQNFGGKIFWRNCDFETLAEKTLANPRLACIFIIVRARYL